MVSAAARRFAAADILARVAMDRLLPRMAAHCSERDPLVQRYGAWPTAPTDAVPQSHPLATR